MKLLKIESNLGYYLNKLGKYVSIDEINKEDLLDLVSLTLDNEDVQFDEYDESNLKNQAHRIIYKSIIDKLASLGARRQEYLDESARMYLDEYDKYRQDLGEN